MGKNYTHKKNREQFLGVPPFSLHKGTKIIEIVKSFPMKNALMQKRMGSHKYYFKLNYNFGILNLVQQELIDSN